MNEQRKSHWEHVYAEKSEAQLSWHQDDPALSVALAAELGISPNAAVIDVGGGRSRFTEAMRAQGVSDLTVLDLSAHALAATRNRLGPEGDTVSFIQADITDWRPDRHYDLWHDRAVLHFLTEAADREAYRGALQRATQPGAYAIIATFALDGPEKCSGLPVMRYSPDMLSQTLGPGFALIASQAHQHVTPWGRAQSFQYSVLQRRG